MQMSIAVRDRCTAVVLLVITFSFFFKTTYFDFMLIWDDGDLIVRNPWFQLPLPSAIASAFSAPLLNMYLPVQITSYLVDHAIWGMDPFGFHLTNVVVHALETGSAAQKVRCS